MEDVNALAFATELSKKFREACDTLRANGLDPTKDGVTLSYGAMLALCDSIEQLERELNAALKDADRSYHAAKEATDSYYVMLRERDAAMDQLVKFEYPIPCESDELALSEYCEKHCSFRTPQKECWMEYFSRRGVQEVE